MRVAEPSTTSIILDPIVDAEEGRNAGSDVVSLRDEHTMIDP
jgi:hypothetical protein